jgi:hypothetical protein
MADATLINHGMRVRQINYLPDVKTHIIHFESEAGSLFINMDRKEFGDFMYEAVKSWGIASNQLMEEIKKEITK